MPPVFEPARGVLVSTLVILAVLVWTRAFSNTDTAESGISLEEWNKPAQGVLIRNVSKMKSKSSLVLREIGSIFVDENIVLRQRRGRLLAWRGTSSPPSHRVPS
jgi:hypothetical protein